MIEIKNVSFCYDNSENGVKNINLKIHSGECVVLTGPSGGGKTTITRILNGLIPAFYQGELNGQLILDNQAMCELATYKIGEKVGSIFQDPKSQFFSSDLKGEVAFACENYGFSNDEIRERTQKSIDTFGLNELKNKSLDVLSSGEKQKVAVASVYALNPNVYVCDEPTSNLDDDGIAILFHTFKKLKSEGKTLIIAEHRLSWLTEIADRYIYVSNGTVMWEKTPKQMAEFVAFDMEKYGLRCLNEKINAESYSKVRENGIALSAKGLSLKKQNKIIFKNQNLQISKERITALIGNNGIGKSSLAIVLTGLLKQSCGDIFIGDEKASANKRRKEIWYSANDTSTQFFTNSVTDELLLNSKHSKERLEKTRSILKSFGLYEYKDSHPASLSGGQKQRLSIACGILSERKIMIFDEPTSGLDGGNMKIIANQLKNESNKGKTILVITHDIEFSNLVADNVITLAKS